MSLSETTASTAPVRGLLSPARGATTSEAAARLYVQAWSRTQTGMAIAGVVGIACVAYACWLATGAVVPWDSKNHFYPMFRFLADALQHGEIPIWNPYHFSGYPAIADPQSLIFTPSMVLFALMAPKASMQAFDAAILLQLLVGGLGILGLVRRRGWHPAAGVLAAMIYMLGGAASSRLQHTGMIISYAYFPLALWTLEIALERASYRFAAVFGLFAALMALGRDQVAFLLCLVLAGRVLWACGQSGSALAYARSRLGPLCLAAVIIVAILAVPALLTLQFLGTSNRPGIPFGVAAAGSLAPVNLVTLIAPNFFGSLHTSYDYWGPGYETVTDADWTDRAINYLFIGTIPLVLIVWHGLAGGRVFGRGLGFFVAVLAAAFVYAFGRYTPVFGWCFDWLPGVSLYRRPADATFVINIAFAFMAAYLLHRYVEDGLPRPFRYLSRPLAWTPAILVGLGCALLIGSGLAFSFPGGHLLQSLAEVGLTIALVLGMSLPFLLGRNRQRRVLVAAALVAVSGAELIWRNAASSLNAEPLSRYSVFGDMPQSDADGLAILRKEIAAKQAEGERPRVEILGLGGAWQNASMVLKLENTLGYNPLRIADYERAVGPGENAVDPNMRHYPGTFRGYRCKLATLLGLDYLVLDRPLAKLPRHVPRPVATLLYSSDTMYIYKLGHTAPRAYFAAHVKPTDSDTVLDEHVLPEFDRSREVLIDHSSLINLSGDVLLQDTRTSAVSHVNLTRIDNSVVAMDVDADLPGIVVLQDIYYPGWDVRVDGEQKPVLRANVLFRGVEVPAGHHHVEFSFHPLSVANLAAAAQGLMHRNDD